MNSISSLLKDEDFCDFHKVATRHSIADIFRKGKRCGIYILHFADGMYYVGQSVDVTKRFMQHKKVHDDINALAFKRVSKKNLDNEEKYYIGLLEKFTRLRNISHTTLPELSDTELDNLIPVHNQELWLRDPHSPIEHFSRVEDEILRSKTAKKCKNQLLKDDNFMKHVLPVMREYVRKCIPEPYLTELTYWGCSCLPPYNRRTKLYSRINVRFQEVFTTFFDYEYESNNFSFHVCKSVFDDQVIEQLYDDFPTLEFFDHIYESGGSNQINIGVSDFEDAFNLLQNENFLLAAKKFNLARFRTGAQPWAQYHCPVLADHLLPSALK